MRRAALAVVALAPAFAACTGGPTPPPTSSPASPSGPGVAPVRAGGIVACPASATVIVASRIFYPPWFPLASGLPPDPERCFSTTRAAAGAGYRLAPPPPDGIRVGGVYLVPAHLESTCRRAARRLGFPVACPALLPGSPDAFQPFTEATEFLLDGMFPAPPGYVGFSSGSAQPLRPATGHLDVESDSAYPHGGRFGARGYCSNQRSAGHVVVFGRLAEFVLCPPGSEQHSGHVVLDWEEGGHAYAVSLHGHSTLKRRLDRIVAEHVQLVFPDGTVLAPAGAGGG